MTQASSWKPFCRFAIDTEAELSTAGLELNNLASSNIQTCFASYKYLEVYPLMMFVSAVSAVRKLIAVDECE